MKSQCLAVYELCFMIASNTAKYACNNQTIRLAKA